MHIVIDGLDEIEESERIRFLPEILRVSENCKESRILISSRDEDDIHAFLGTKSTDIRVDTHNANSLQTYVSSRCTKWIRSRNFTPQEKVEIVGLLNPIAAKAQGEWKRRMAFM
jgi:hypothetical protein